MAVGDTADMARRLRIMLPDKWFPDTAPVLTALLQGCGAVWASMFARVMSAFVQSRVATVTGPFLDMAAMDYRGPALMRRPNESDALFRRRLLPLLEDKVTRAALISRLLRLGCPSVAVFEPSRPADCGGAYGYQMGYGVAGQYGSLSYPDQMLVVAQRPAGAGIPIVTGYGGPGGGYGGGAIAYATLALEAPHVTDEDIYAAIVETIPLGSIAWTSLTGAPIGGTAPLDLFVLDINTLAP